MYDIVFEKLVLWGTRVSDFLKLKVIIFNAFIYDTTYYYLVTAI